MVWMRARPASGRVAQLAAPRKATVRKKTRAMARHIFIFVLLGAVLARNLRAYREPPHAPALPVVVVDREVLRAAVVPDRERARRPAHAAGEFRPRLVLLQELDERPAFRFRHVLEVNGVAAADIERLAAGVGMRTHHRMLGLVLLGALGIVHLHSADLAVHLRAAAAVLERRAVHTDQSGEQ